MHHWNEKNVAGQFEEAISTLKKLPPVRAQGYCSTWPDIVRTPEEIEASEPMPLRLRAMFLIRQRIGSLPVHEHGQDVRQQRREQRDDVGETRHHAALLTKWPVSTSISPGASSP